MQKRINIIQYIVYVVFYVEELGEIKKNEKKSSAIPDNTLTDA